VKQGVVVNRKSEVLVTPVCELSGSRVLSISDSGVLVERDSGRDTTGVKSGRVTDIREAGKGVICMGDNGMVEPSRVGEGTS